MKAQDTVMTTKFIVEYLRQLDVPQPTQKGYAFLKTLEMLDAQAEDTWAIAFKAVVEWIKSYVQLDILEDENGHPIPYYCFDDIVLQAKLKEWGIK